MKEVQASEGLVPGVNQTTRSSKKKFMEDFLKINKGQAVQK